MAAHRSAHCYNLYVVETIRRGTTHETGLTFGTDASVVATVYKGQHRLNVRVGKSIAHELGHALGLPDVSNSDNVMGSGGQKLSPEQCAKARGSGYVTPTTEACSPSPQHGNI